MAKILIKRYKRSKYVIIFLDRVLNISWVLNMSEYSISKSSSKSGQ